MNYITQFVMWYLRINIWLWKVRFRRHCLKLILPNFLKDIDIYLSIYPNLSAWVGYDTGSMFERSLNSEYSFSKTSCLAKAKEPSLPYYLPIAGGRIIGFIPFPRVLVQCEMQSVSSRIWSIYLSIKICLYLSIYLSIYLPNKDRTNKKSCKKILFEAIIAEQV